MGKTLYVSNLGDGMTHGSLEQMFGPYGRVWSARVIMDRDTGLSKGFGFVEMSSAARPKQPTRR
jgi:RNA recognition motif-containing protein